MSLYYAQNKLTEPSFPLPLQSTQEWFAGVITSPLVDDYAHIGSDDYFVAEQAGKYIVPSPTLNPYQRIQIYNQQYWWRLLKSMHENFPFAVRLFGYNAFNEEIAIPYLLKYPPNHWSLLLLGEKLPKWISEDYHAPDRPLVLNAVILDLAYTDCFVAEQKKPLNLENVGENPEDLLSQTFYLQPHIHLFKWEYDLMAFRQIFLKEEVEYWLENDFPPLTKEKTQFFILYRTLGNQMAWKELSEAEFTLLEILKKGSSLEAACDFLESQEALYEQTAQNLQNWLKEWTLRQWLTLQK
jgi:hypothetical protein